MGIYVLFTTLFPFEEKCTLLGPKTSLDLVINIGSCRLASCRQGWSTQLRTVWEREWVPCSSVRSMLVPFASQTLLIVSLEPLPRGCL